MKVYEVAVASGEVVVVESDKGWTYVACLVKEVTGESAVSVTAYWK